MLSTLSAYIQTHKQELLLLVVGAAVSLAVAFLAKAIWIGCRCGYIRLFRPSVLAGKWYTYHFTTEQGKVVFREELWDIRLNLFGKYSVKTTDPERPSLTYFGTLQSGQEPVCLMRGKGSNEVYFMRMLCSIPNRDGVNYGLKVGVDFDGNVFSTIYLFSRSQIDNRRSAQLNVLSKVKAGTSRHFMKLT